MYQDVLEEKKKYKKRLPLNRRDPRYRKLKQRKMDGIGFGANNLVSEQRKANKQTEKDIGGLEKTALIIGKGLKLVLDILKSEQGLILLGALALLGAIKSLNKEDESGDYGDYSSSYGRYEEKDEKSKIKNKIIDEAEKQGVDPALALAMAEAESGFSQFDSKGQLLKPEKYKNDPDSPVGIFQIKPSTAKGMGYSDVTQIDNNIAAGVAYLRNQLKSFGGDRNKALAAYNAGPNAVRKYNGIPPFKETEKYVNSINNSYNKYKKELEQMAPKGAPVITGKGGNIGGYTIQPDVIRSKQMDTYIQHLSDTGGFGTITSIVRPQSGSVKNVKSHASGNKIDFGLGAYISNTEQVIKICLPIMRDPATVHVAFEGFGRKDDNEDSIKKSKAIVDKICKRYPDIAKRITNNPDEAYRNPNKIIIYHWGWTKGGPGHHATGPHLDVLINPALLNYKEQDSYTEEKKNTPKPIPDKPKKEEEKQKDKKSENKGNITLTPPKQQPKAKPTAAIDTAQVNTKLAKQKGQNTARKTRKS